MLLPFNMAIMSSSNKNLIILLLSWLLFSSNSLHASEDPQRKPTTKVVVIGGGGDCNYGNNLKDILNYAELKHDSKASLPSSFTICVSVMDNHGFRLKLKGLPTLVADNFGTVLLASMQKLTQYGCFPISGFGSVWLSTHHRASSMGCTRRAFGQYHSC